MNDAIKTPLILPPSPTVWDLVKSVLGYGVWVAFGLSPFLGKTKVPGFSALLEMYPYSLAHWLIPASGLLMGMIAIAIDFLAGRKASKSSERKLTRWFQRTVMTFLASFALLIVLYVLLVTNVEMVAATQGGQPERTSFAVVTGTLTVPRQPPGSDCKCLEGQTAEQCIENTSLNMSNVRRCFGPQRVALASIALAALYFTLTGTFVAAVGLLRILRRL